MKNQNLIDRDFDYDVIIVGCGPAGSITARYIQPKKNNLRVLILDRKKEIGIPVQCGEGVVGFLGDHEIGPLVYDKKGLFECPEKIKAQRIDKMQFISPKHKIIEIPVKGNTIHRDLFDQYLAQRAFKNGAIIKKGVNFLGFKDKHTILTNIGEITGNIIVGADGPISSVAKCCGLQPPKILAKCIFTKIKGDFNGHMLKQFYKKEFRTGYGWIFPKGDHANVGVGTELYKDPTNTKLSLRKILDDFIQKELNITEEDIFFRGGGLVPSCGLIPRLIKENVLVVGDAAGMVHPSTGAGIGSAMIAGRECGTAIMKYFMCNEDLKNYEERVRDIYQADYQKGLMVKKIFQLLSKNDITFDLAFWFVKKVGITKFMI